MLPSIMFITYSTETLSKWNSQLIFGIKLSDINSLDFVVNQFFVKLFFTSDITIVSECQQMFNFKLPSEQLAQRKDNFISRLDSTVCDV